MIAWHGTNKLFDKFDLTKIGSGEGCAKRGWGVNAACDPGVARYYMERLPGNTGYLLKLSVPDLEELISLDSSVESCVGNLECLVSEYYKLVSGVDIDDVFDAAAEDDDVSLSYSDDRAREMLNRILINTGDAEAWDELKEWSPGYEWDAFRSKICAHGLELDPHFDTGLQFYTSLVSGSANKTEQEICAWLSANGVKGTYGHEPINSNDKQNDTISLVVFDPRDIQIKNVESHPRSDKDKNVNSSFDLP